jgi:hypothetical protein
MIRANSELQLRCDDIILLIHKLFLSKLSPKHTQKEKPSAGEVPARVHLTSAHGVTSWCTMHGGALLVFYPFQAKCR